MATDQRKDYQREWVANRRQHYINLFGGVCCKCGSDDCLEFDHVDPDKKFTHRIFSYSHERIKDELSKCQLLCKECHIKKTNLDLGRGAVHGTVNMYKKYKCRCEPCRQAKRDSR